MGRHQNLQIKTSENQKDSDKELESKSDEILEEEYNEHEADEYDDRWDYLYDDIEWQNQRTKIRKSEKKEDKQRGLYNTRL